MRGVWRWIVTCGGLPICVLTGVIVGYFTPAAAAEPPWSPVEVSVFETDQGFRFANDYGVPFFRSDRDSGGKIGCDDACTGTTWLPVWARDSAKPQGDWSIVIRPDKTPQWAYKGIPIYNYNGPESPPEVIALAKQDGHWHQVQP